MHADIGCAAVAVADAPARRAGPFRLGVVGGVGPAATVDFMAKIVRNTPAGRDQDHLKVVVDQNPQIPDRTAHLAGAGPDPTLALYAACLRLQEAGAGLIAIPCNTAHAFVARLQPRLAVPIVNMLAATADRACALLPAGAAVGLLATDGTVRSRLYDDAFAATGLRLVTPDAAHQRLVMEAIYGGDGIKAGRTNGACRDRLLAALRHLVDRGARAIVLGCTELPLVLRGADVDVDGLRVRVLDPTDILAQACVARATAHAAAEARPAAHAAE
jgi:aspartate racemase